MKRILFFVLILAALVSAQTVQQRPDHAAKSGFFETAFCPQWADTATVPVFGDTLFFVAGSTVRSQMFRNWPYLSGVLTAVASDSLQLQALQLWVAPVNDTSKMVYSKTLLFTPSAGGTSDSTLTSAGNYAVDFSTGGAWHPMLWCQLRAVSGPTNKVAIGNKLRLLLQGYSTK